MRGWVRVVMMVRIVSVMQGDGDGDGESEGMGEGGDDGENSVSERNSEVMLRTRTINEFN